MRKLSAFIFLCCLFFPFKIVALEEKGNEIYLSDLSVAGFKLSPSFDKYNNLYTLIIEEYLTQVEVHATPLGEGSVVIEGNDNLHEGINYVYVKVFNEVNEATYEIIVTILNDDAKQTFGSNNNFIQKRVIGEKEISLIVLSCFALIVLVFRILFVRKVKR